MIVMMMAPRSDDVREYLADMILRALGSVMQRLDSTRSENDQGRDLAAMVEGDQPQDMDTGTLGDGATNSQVRTP